MKIILLLVSITPLSPKRARLGAGQARQMKPGGHLNFVSDMTWLTQRTSDDVTGTGDQEVQHAPVLDRCSLVSFEPVLNHGNKMLPVSAARRKLPGLLTRPRRVSLFFEEGVRVNSDWRGITIAPSLPGPPPYRRVGLLWLALTSDGGLPSGKGNEKRLPAVICPDRKDGGHFTFHERPVALWVPHGKPTSDLIRVAMMDALFLNAGSSSVANDEQRAILAWEGNSCISIGWAQCLFSNQR